MPVFESPSYHGYDTTDYEKIQPAYGTSEDFDRFLAEAHRRGIRVIVDFVMNHTSSKHPWFLDSASSFSSRHRDWYVWRTDNPGGNSLSGTVPSGTPTPTAPTLSPATTTASSGAACRTSTSATRRSARRWSAWPPTGSAAASTVFASTPPATSSPTARGICRTTSPRPTTIFGSTPRACARPSRRPRWWGRTGPTRRSPPTTARRRR